MLLAADAGGGVGVDAAEAADDPPPGSAPLINDLKFGGTNGMCGVRSGCSEAKCALTSSPVSSSRSSHRLHWNLTFFTSKLASGCCFEKWTLRFPFIVVVVLQRLQKSANRTSSLLELFLCFLSLSPSSEVLS